MDSSNLADPATSLPVYAEHGNWYDLLAQTTILANSSGVDVAGAKKARESLMTFVRALGKREKGKRYLLKVTLKEGDTVEHVWLEPVRWNDPGLLGVLAVDPVEIKKHKKGDVIYPLPADVSDWLILSEDGTKEGGFTADVIEKRRAAAKKGKPEGAGASAAESESESGEKEKPEGGEKEKPEEKSDGSSR